MPPNWYVEGAKAANGLQKRILSLAVVAGIALVGLKGDALGLDFDGVEDALKSIPVAIAAIPTAIKSMSSNSPKPASPAPAASTAPAEQETTATAAETVDANDEDEDDHPHSVKPFSHDPPAFEENLDKSWLDKGITKIENAVKAFFRIKI